MLTHTTTRLLAQLASARAGFPGGVLSQRHATVSGFSMPPTAVRWLHDNIPSTPPASDKPGGGRSKSPIEKYIAPGRPPKVVRSTFDPQKLIASDFVDISGRVKHQIYFVDGKAAKLNVQYYNQGSQAHGFPKGSHGFFYWTPPPPSFPSIAGELRFRVTQSEDPASFETGHDLQVHLGSTWRVPLCSIVHTNYGGPIRAQLLKEGLIHQETVEGWFPLAKPAQVKSQADILYHLGQNFDLDLSKYKRGCTVVSKRGTGIFYLRRLFEYSVLGEFVRPFKGVITVRFERSTLPEHAGTRTLLLRVVDVPDSVHRVDPNYNGPILFPVAGELVKVARKAKKTKIFPWAFDIDNKSHAALAFLWDTEG